MEEIRANPWGGANHRIMTIVALGLFLLVCYGVVRLAARLMGAIGGSRYRAYRLLAQKYRGKYESRGLVDPPTVSFHHGGSNVRVGLAPVIPGQAAVSRTRLVARFAQGLPFRMELTPHGRSAPIQPPKGTRGVRTGAADLNRLYQIQANDPAIACALLEADSVRGALENLRRIAPAGGMVVSASPERLLVQIDRNLGSSAPLLELVVRSCLLIHDRLLESVAAQVREGVEIVGSGAGMLDEDGAAECTVCGDMIEGEHVVCDRCKTPFHRDCWTFVGGCSTYGCQCKRFTVS